MDDAKRHFALMRLLLTRSAADAARTREKLEAMGHKVIVSPVIDMVPTGATFPSGVVDALIATSAQAFAVPLDGPTPEAQRLMPLFCVGGRTAEAANAAGFLGAVTVAPNAAALAESIGALANRPRRVVYLAAHDRKPDLEAALDAMAQTLDVVEIYEARPIETLGAEAADAFARQAIDGVLHFSRRSAELFLSAATKGGVDTKQLLHFCLSDDAAGPLRDAGSSRIEVAEAPNESELLTCIKNH